MDEQKRTDPQEQEPEQEQKLGDLDVPDEQGDAVEGGGFTDRNTDFKEKFP
jgi:hypothetical protein